MSKAKNPRPLNAAEYKALAEFRYQLRRFLRNMEEHARGIGHHPQQYQLLLAIKGLPRGQAPTIGAMADRMQLNHNTTDRKSTRLNSSHQIISYAVFCLKKKKTKKNIQRTDKTHTPRSHPALHARLL